MEKTFGLYDGDEPSARIAPVFDVHHDERALGAAERLLARLLHVQVERQPSWRPGSGSRVVSSPCGLPSESTCTRLAPFAPAQVAVVGGLDAGDADAVALLDARDRACP